MPIDLEQDIAHENAVWNWKATEVFFRLIREQNEITADDFVRECRKIQMPSFQINRNAGILFKSMKSVGYICKTDRYKLSERGSSPLPIYVTKPDQRSD